MGLYIEQPGPTGKCEWLLTQGAVEVFHPTSEDAKESVLLCVVNNGAFEACAICYDVKEFDAFSDYQDLRKKRWFRVTRDFAVEQCPRADKVLSYGALNFHMTPKVLPKRFKVIR
jgi:hypothetical protein